MTANKKIPALRFPEFEDEWEEKKLGDIASFSKGKNLSKADIVANGKFECIRYGELYTHYNERIDSIVSRTNLDESQLIFSKENDVIIPGSGETQIDIATASCVIKEGVALGGDLNIIRSLKNNGVFLAFYLNNAKKKDIAVLAQGNAVVHLYSSQLATLDLNLPSFQEQQKIASFLTAVDDKILQLTKKKTLLAQYKKGVMQQIFSQQIRFKDDNGNDYPDWEEKKLGNYVKIKSGGSPSNYNVKKIGMFPFLKVEELNSSTKYQTGISREYTDIATNHVETFSIIFPKRGAAIMNNKIRINTVPVQIDSNLMAIKPVNNLVTTEYLFYMISHIELFKIADTSTIPQINNKHIEPYKFQLPHYHEQQKIANILTSIDDKINAVSSQLEQTQQFKKGLLQQMFV